MSATPIALTAPLTEEQQVLIAENRRFEHYVLRHYGRKYGEVLDDGVIQQCIDIALTDTARTYDEDSGVRFEYYARQKACWAIEKAAARELRHMYRVRRAADACMLLQESEGDVRTDTDQQMQNTATGITERLITAMVIGLASEAAATDAVKGENGVIAEIDHRNALQRVRSSLPKLNERRRAIIGGVYGDPEQQLKEIAQQLGVSYRTVRREHKEALTELHEFLQH